MHQLTLTYKVEQYPATTTAKYHTEKLYTRAFGKVSPKFSWNDISRTCIISMEEEIPAKALEVIAAINSDIKPSCFTTSIQTSGTSTF